MWDHEKVDVLREMLEQWRRTNGYLSRISDSLATLAVELKPTPPALVSGKLILGKPVAQ